MSHDISGPIILWQYYGYEGWMPKSYPTLTLALSEPRHTSDFVVTENITFEVVKKPC